MGGDERPNVSSLERCQAGPLTRERGLVGLSAIKGIRGDPVERGLMCPPLIVYPLCTRIDSKSCFAIYFPRPVCLRKTAFREYIIVILGSLAILAKSRKCDILCSLQDSQTSKRMQQRHAEWAFKMDIYDGQAAKTSIMDMHCGNVDIKYGQAA
jgi:hypothetical protein